MGFELPFRYSANLKFALSKPFSFSLSFPVYSDPYFTDDFSDRSEYIDWLGFLMGEGEDEESSSSSSISSFTWQASASYNVSLPDFIKPYVSSFSTNISSSVSFSSKERGSSYDTDFNDKPSDWRSYTPERKFFYPSQVSPFKISGSISGTIFSYPFTVQKSKSSASEFPVKLEVPDEFLTEEEKVKKEEERLKKLSEKENKDEQESSAEKKDEVNVPEKKEETVLAESDLPLIQPSLSTTVQDFKGLEYSLTYSLSPQYSSEISYNSAELYKPEDFEWSNIYSSYYQVRVPVNLTSKLSYRSSFASMTNNFSFNPNFQNHPNLDGYKEEQKKNVRKTDYEARKLDLTNTNSVSIKPFIYSPVWKNTSISWNTTVKVIQTEFLGDADNPEWKYNLAELWDKDDFTAHTLSATISAEEGEYSQTLTLSTKLPPQIDEYTGTLKFGFPLASLSFSSGLRQKSANDETYEKLPFQQSASLKLFDKKLTLSESYNFKLEDWHSDSLKFSASYSGFSLSYTMSYIYGYDFDSDAKAWKKKTEQEFQPSSINFSYSTSGKTMYAWKNRITLSPALSTSISYDCLRPTNSSFRFVPSLTFKIHEFLDLTFSAESSNNVIFRYFQKYTDYGDVIPGETNPFVDLFNSFKFWSDDEFYDSNQTARKSSGFKVKTFKITVSHSLHDWDMAASLSFKPRTITENGKSTYDYSPYFSFGVTWRPLPSMKTQIVDEYGEWELNP